MSLEARYNNSVPGIRIGTQSRLVCADHFVELRRLACPFDGDHWWICHRQNLRMPPHISRASSTGQNWGGRQ
eukprot:4072491-Prorocentrum_lima.AAC.1